MDAKKNREESLRLSQEVRRRIEAEREYEFERKLRSRQGIGGVPAIVRLRTIVARDYPLAEPALLAQMREGDRRSYWDQLRALRAQVDLQLRLHRQLSAQRGDFEGLVRMRLRVEWAFVRLALAPWAHELNPGWTDALFGSVNAALQPIWDRATVR